MPESTPLTAAERERVRATDAPETYTRRLLDERDALAAQLAEAEHAYAEAVRLNDDLGTRLAGYRGILVLAGPTRPLALPGAAEPIEMPEPQTLASILDALAEARGIARRLREAIRWSNDIIEETDACAAFDALHWPD